MASSIELKILSCKGIKSFNFFQKLSVYALVSLGSGDRDKDRRLQTQKTPVNRDGGNNPEWNHEMRFDLEEIADSDPKSLFLEIDILTDGIFGDKLVGEVLVPLTDLIDESNGALRFVSYQVRSADRKPNGILNFSYQVNLKGKIASYPTVEIDSPPAIYYLAPSPPATGYLPPPAHVAYFPPPPPPPPPVSLPFVYPHQPDPYGFRQEGYGYQPYGYPTVEQPGPLDDDTWRRGLGDGGYAGYFR
ncbi:protein SRC2-like [Magnolia sinica]|uniref:protein SRC2-like n=1 Tax=Magnolia sinica TaxID=86752 RepID=UPI00265B4102|nr:protein SRC2-like [Magnolia sinica]